MEPEPMRAWLYRRYGGPDVVQLEEVAKPAPREDELLVRIHATTVTAGDWRVRTLAVPRGLGPLARVALGVTRPRQPILGMELAGVVEAVGARVTRFRPGDEIFAFPGEKLGCHAEYRALAEDDAVARMPQGLSFEEAASLPFGGSTALHFLRKAALEPGEKVLVIGASGAVGTALVQLARHRGAEVTGVTSTRNVELVASLGAAEVVDYTKQDALQAGRAYDVIADTVGATTLARSRDALREGGRLLAIAGGLPEMLATATWRLRGTKKAIAGPAPERLEDLRELAALAESGALRPVIDRRYAFEQMREAHAYVETRRKRGSVVVRVVREG